MIKPLARPENFTMWPCSGRGLEGFPDAVGLRREHDRKGTCNSSHGGSCCVCGGKLPETHMHLTAAGFEIGGNVCSEGCAIRFFVWAEAPHGHSICPGHAGRHGAL